jgi:hypothetical protein
MIIKVIAGIVSFLGACGIPVAHADPAPTFTDAAQALQQLQSWGYVVHVSGLTDTLPRCHVSGLYPLVIGPTTSFQTVYLQVFCINTNEEPEPLAE